MVILPPAREISLWIRKHLQELGLPESAMYLTITAVEQGRSDTRGRWILVKADHTEQWKAGRSFNPFSFKARPDTLWPVIEPGRPYFNEKIVAGSEASSKQTCPYTLYGTEILAEGNGYRVTGKGYNHACGTSFSLVKLGHGRIAGFTILSDALQAFEQAATAGGE